MKLNAVAFSFELQKGDSLMSLVKTCGYSKPTKDDPVARRTLADFVCDKVPQIEVTRKSETTVFARIYPGDAMDDTPQMVETFFDHLREAGLIPTG